MSVLFMNAGKSKNPGSPIGVGDDREVVVAAASPPSVILAFPFCHPCEREDPVSVLFMNAGKSKHPGSPIGVGDDREVVVAAASPPSVILAFPFCHPCEREDPVSVLFMNAGKSKNPGSPIGVGDDREVVVVAASPPSVILAFPFCHPCEREDPVSVLFMNAGKSKTPGSPIGVGDDRQKQKDKRKTLDPRPSRG